MIDPTEVSLIVLTIVLISGFVGMGIVFFYTVLEGWR